MGLEGFDEDGGGFSAADAGAGDGELAATASEFVEGGHDQAGASGADWVADGDGSAVDIEFFVGDAEFAGGIHGDDGEGFVDFEEVDVINGFTGSFEQVFDRGGRGGGEPLGFLGELAIGDDFADGFETVLFNRFGGGENHGGGSVVDGASVAGGGHTFFAESGAKFGEFVDASATGFFVLADGDGVAFALGDFDGRDFASEFIGGALGATVAFGGEFVEFFAGEVLFAGALVAARAHVDVVVRIPEAVVDHEVDGGLVAHAHTGSGGGESIGGVGHGFHATGDDDVSIAAFDGLRGHHDGFHAGAADFVDGGAGYAVGDSGAFGGLSGRGLAESAAEDVAHEDFIDLVGFYVSGFEGGFDGVGSELRGGEVGEGALK